MIGSGGKKVAAVQQRTANLEQRVEDLSARLASLENQLGLATERSQAQAAELATAAHRTAALASLVDEQAAAIEQLNERQERHREFDSQVRADLVRLERQASVDMTELRQTSLALAERLLRFPQQKMGA